MKPHVLVSSLAPALTALGLALVVALGGCGGGGKVLSPDDAPAPAARPEPAAPDAFRDFKGELVDADTPFMIDDLDRGVRGLEVVIHVDKVTTTTWSPGGGRPDEVEGTATIIVKRGVDEKSIRVREGMDATALGVRVAVLDADVRYDDDRMLWLPTAKIQVSKAPPAGE
ncbi:MAG: hypothetical protein H6745_11285 [Deltaproteobacteria bacterium]|nr:hypothetical protein [Deltaproteobacteria bacterium]